MTAMNGSVLSGLTDHNPQFLAGVSVSLLECRDGETVTIGQATTSNRGAFTIPAPADSTTGVFYAIADLGNGVLLLTLLGSRLPGYATLNELTTVAGAYCAAQFVCDGALRGNDFGLRIAAGMSGNLVNLDYGTYSPVLTSSPNGSETTTWQVVAALANALAGCVRDPGKSLDLLFRAATPPFAPQPKDTLTALSNVARFPANHVGPIYALSTRCPIYTNALPGPAPNPLTAQPDAWTIAVKVNDSGNDDQMFGGPASIVFDKNGNGWISNNVIQGQPVSAPWCMVLDSTGRPAVDSNQKVMSPFTGGGLLGAGFGIALDSKGQVWVGDFGWGKDFPQGSVSVFNPDAQPLSPAPNGYTKHLYRVQGTVVDAEDNVWLASYGNGSVVVFPGGDPEKAVAYLGDPNSFKPFGIAIAEDGSAWVSNAYSGSSGIVNLRLRGGKLERVREATFGNVNKGVAIDSQGVIWVGSGGDDHVYALDPDGDLIGGYQGGGIAGPWGVTLDGDDNLWVANFGPLEEGSVFTGRLTQIAGSLTPNRRMGDGLSPQSGYTVPSAGAQVLLHDGTPLYGPDGPPCYTPMMRTTGVTVDAAGNVWSCNNWKPAFNNDLFGDPFTGSPGNPGGDGLLIFIGLAKPR